MGSRRSAFSATMGCTLVAALFAAGCGGSPTAPKDDEVFYLHGGGVIDKDRSWEVYFPKLDKDKTVTLPRQIGVGVLDGDVRFARPIDWTVRDASYTPERRFISYTSPRQFTFSIFERVASLGPTCSSVTRRRRRIKAPSCSPRGSRSARPTRRAGRT
jgi:hypothetical protein